MSAVHWSHMVTFCVLHKPMPVFDIVVHPAYVIFNNILIIIVMLLLLDQSTQHFFMLIIFLLNYMFRHLCHLQVFLLLEH
jgi:hypothetical protein